MRRQILRFFRSQNLWKPCPVIDEALWRNKPSHAEAHYNPETNTLTIGNLEVEFEDLEKKYRAILGFNAELINQCFIKGGIFKNLELCKDICEKALKKLDKQKEK